MVMQFVFFGHVSYVLSGLVNQRVMDPLIIK